MSAASEFSLTIQETARSIEIVARGAIDESTSLKAPPSGGRPVIIDCAEVRRLNSRGVATWCHFMTQLTQQGPVVLRRMSPLMVTAASMVSSFIGRATIESFMSPWLCPSCDGTLEQLHGFKDPLPDEVQCPRCPAMMQLNWDRDAYLAFREI